MHTLSLGANGFTFLTTSHLMLTLIFLFLNSQTCSLSVVQLLLCSNLKDDLCKLNLVLISFSVSPIYVSWLFEVFFCNVCFVYNAISEETCRQVGKSFFFLRTLT